MHTDPASGSDDTALAGGTLIEALEWQAHMHPDRLACVHLQDGETPVARLSFGDLVDTARAHAVMLARRARPGARVLLVFPNTPDFLPVFLGCLFAGLVAVPVSPPRSVRAMERLRALAGVAGADLAILSPRLRGGFDRLRGDAAPLGGPVDGPEWLFCDELEPGDPRDWVDPGIAPDTLAVLQFTSGSTGMSKGVMVRHANILHNARMFRAEIAPEVDIRLVTWLPFFHDWGLFGCLCYPLIAGGSSIYFDPVDFLQRPMRWVEAISAHQATVCCAPNFAFDLVTRALGQNASALDLSSLVMAKFGAEPIRRETMAAFADACAPLGFDAAALRPSYGLAEATLIVTGGGRNVPARSITVARKPLETGHVVVATPDCDTTRDVVSCGRPLLDQQVRIVDPVTRRPMAAGRVGEIWISGANVTTGYWQAPEETAQSFGARIGGEPGDWLRSGDLGFEDGGEIFVCGRLKDVIIKTGANYFAEDIEASADASHPGLRPGCGAAFGIDAGGAERLVVVQEIDYGPRPDLAQVVGAIQRAVSRDHGVLADAIAVLRPGTLEKTSSGKIRRGHTRALFENDALDPLRVWRCW